VFLALDRLAELVLFQLLGLQYLVAPGFEMAEATVEAARLAAVEPDGGVGDLFEEAAVVRDDDEGRAGRLQLAFQPFDGRKVEMVGRLVEQEDIRFRRHDAGERRPARLAAGERLRVLGAVEAKMFEQVGDAIGVVGRAETGFGIGGDRVVAIEIRRLVQVADGGGRVAEDFARLRLGKVGGDLHQRRLARAVAADEADAVAGFHLQACAGKQRRAAEAQEDVVEFEDRRCQGSGS
jgi:hypothetical protein